MFFTEGPAQDALVNEIQQNEYAMHDPYDIASRFITLHEGGKEYFDENTGMHTAYADTLVNNLPTLAMGLTGEIGGEPIEIGKQYHTSVVNPAFQAKLQEDYKRLDNALDGSLSSNTFNPNQQASIMSLLYNVGYGNLKGTKAFDALKSGDLDMFKEEAFGPTGFNKASGEFVQGLQNRRDAERALFDTPIR